MFKVQKTYIYPSMKMADLISENPSLLIILEHFDLDGIVQEKSLSELCLENKISEKVFLSFANTYNGFPLPGESYFSEEDIEPIMRYLKNNHRFYKNEKYGEIQSYIKKLSTENELPEVKLIEDFFYEYTKEVDIHLEYEDNTVFPYIKSLLDGNKTNRDFLVEQYGEHHTDIEFKLIELKDLLLKHVALKKGLSIRRKLLQSLFEFEYDLAIHSLIEEKILVPLVMNFERKRIRE